MTTKWWKTGLLVIAALLMAGVPTVQGVSATFIDGWDPVTQTHLAALPAVLPPGGWVIVEFPDALPASEEQPPAVISVDTTGDPSGEYTLLSLGQSYLGEDQQLHWLWDGPFDTSGNQFDGAAAAAQAGLPGWGFDNGTVNFGVSANYVQWSTVKRLWIQNGLVTGDLTVTAVRVAPFTAPEMIADLITKVQGINDEQGIPSVIQSSLEAKLRNAVEALDEVKKNSNAAAANKLQAFINEVEAQRGDKITDDQADELIADAQDIVGALTGT
jgi:hypothetical protein